MVQHKTKPPRAAAWETFILSQNGPGPWLIENQKLPIRTRISSKLKDSLLTARLIRLARSTLREHDNDGEWECSRFLGSGAFGAAALFTKSDNVGNLQDEIVVKHVTVVEQEKHCPYILRIPGTNGRYMAMEALIHNLVNSHRCDNLVYLRGCKAIFTDGRYPDLPRQAIHYEGSPKAFMRYYLEYAPYGSLANLIDRYKAFNKYLPELFLWHLFNSLAKAVLVLERNFVVHFDIKPDNIFLGYEATKSRRPEVTGGLDGELKGYPSIKLGDFGLSEMMSRVSPKSMKDIGDTGTRGYKAPEILRANQNLPKNRTFQYGGDWEPPANRPDESVTPEANVWGVGKVMYDAFSLSYPGSFDAYAAKSRLEYDCNNQKPIRDYVTIPFTSDRLHNSSPYTKNLSDLIENCMHVEPSRRPTAAELYEVTRAAMIQCDADPEAVLPFSVRRRRLYYRGNEINSMSHDEKNCWKVLYPQEYFKLLNPTNNVPGEPELDIYPEQMWETILDARTAELAEANHQEHKEAENWKFAFRTHIHQDQKRMIIGDARIDLFDPDPQLTYEGTKNEQWFLDEGKQNDSTGNRGDVDDGNDDNDDDGNDGSEPGPGSYVDLLGGNKAAPAVGHKKDIRTPKKPGAGHPGVQDGNQAQQALGNGSRRQSYRPRFSPYNPHNRRNESSERAWVHGSGRQHIAKFDPYLRKPVTQQVEAKPKGKRAADTFGSRGKQLPKDGLGNAEQRRPSKRQRIS